MKKLKKAGLFTDIHYGRKNNSREHNNDCVNFVDWFITKCSEYEVDHINFLGDWFEERQAIDSLTGNTAFKCAKKLNDLNIPIYFIVGNHDLYHRDSREIFATYAYSELDNFVIIDEPTVIHDTLKPTLFCPFLFENEYPKILPSYFDIPVWMGHFEFKGFVLTGDVITKRDGPDPDNYSAPEIIMSGHFHKRQSSKNVNYIGNTFPMDFGDVNDFNRGMAVFDYESGELQYTNWDECPTYLKMTLSELNDNPKLLKKNARVKCDADLDITFEQHSQLKNALIEKYNLREFNLNEIMDIRIIDADDNEEEIAASTTNELVRNLLKRVEGESIDSEILIEIYDDL